MHLIGCTKVYAEKMQSQGATRMHNQQIVTMFCANLCSFLHFDPCLALEQCSVLTFSLMNKIFVHAH